MKALLRVLPILALVAVLLAPGNAAAAANVTFKPFGGTPPTGTWVVAAVPTNSTSASSSTCTLDSVGGTCAMSLAASTGYNVSVSNGTDVIPQPSVYVTANNQVVTTNLGGGDTDGPNNATRLYRGTYSFAVNGGTSGDISLGVNGSAANVQPLPANAIILDGLVDVVTACTGGGGAAISVGYSVGNNVNRGGIMQTGVVGTQCSSGLHAISQANTAATATKLSSGGQPIITISGASLTAGQVDVLLRYVVSG